MLRLSRTIPLIFTSVAVLPLTFVPAGECQYAEFCAEPCPAENSCYGDDDCEGGLVCRPACLPSFCYCSPATGEWAACTTDCVGECGERPDHANPPRYVIIDLGTLGGWSSVALGVNELGQVVGSADIPTGPRHAYLWDRGVMTDLGTVPPTIQSEAWDINNHTQVVGISTDTGRPAFAFLWEDGELIDLGHLRTTGTSARAINDAGQVIGRSSVGFEEYHSFLWEDGVMIDLLATLGVGGAADINDKGHVAASTGSHAALWDGYSLVDLGTLGGQYSFSTSLNDLDQVVGYSERAPGGDRVVHAFLWDSGEMIDLGAIGDLASSRARAINNCGQVIGGQFLYDPDKGMEDLEYLLPPDIEWQSLTPRDINDAGQIVGSGTTPRGQHAFLMTPIDADLDGDNDTDLVDYEFFRSCLTGPSTPAAPACTGQDVNRNGHVDLDDFRAFLWHFAEP